MLVHMSRNTRKPAFLLYHNFLSRSDTNRPVQLQKMAKLEERNGSCTISACTIGVAKTKAL